MNIKNIKNPSVILNIKVVSTEKGYYQLVLENSIEHGKSLIVIRLTQVNSLVSICLNYDLSKLLTVLYNIPFIDYKELSKKRSYKTVSALMIKLSQDHKQFLI